MATETTFTVPSDQFPGGNRLRLVARRDCRTGTDYPDSGRGDTVLLGAGNCNRRIRGRYTNLEAESLPVTEFWTDAWDGQDTEPSGLTEIDEEEGVKDRDALI